MEINENNMDFNNVDDLIRSPDYQLVLKMIREQRENSFKKYNYKQSTEPEERNFNRIYAEDDEDVDNIAPKKETKKEKKKKKRKNSEEEKPKKKYKKKKAE